MYWVRNVRTLVSCHQCLTLAHFCRAYPFPVSIAMTDFFRPSRLCASFGSSWYTFVSVRTLSIHLSMGSLRGLFPPTFIVVTSFATFLSSHLITWPYHKRRFWVTMVICLTICIAPDLFISDSVFPCFALRICISVVCIIFCSSLCKLGHVGQDHRFSLIQHIPLYISFFRSFRNILSANRFSCGHSFSESELDIPKFHYLSYPITDYRAYVPKVSSCQTLT